LREEALGRADVVRILRIDEKMAIDPVAFDGSESEAQLHIRED